MKPLILVLKDDIVRADTVRDVIAYAGCDARYALSGEVALTLFKSIRSRLSSPT